MFDRRFEKDVAITGIGQSEIARPSSKTALRLTVDSCMQAINDAGLKRSDIDGVAAWPGDNNNGDGFSPVGTGAVITHLGLNVNWYGAGYEGPGPITGIINGAMAIAAGLCRHVLVYRTINEATTRSISRTSNSLASKTVGRDGNYSWQWLTPFNVLSASSMAAMYAQRHFHEFGTTPEQLAQIALTYRKHASLNPKALFREPLTMDDYMSSRMITTPLRLYDCDVHCDASTAVILSRVDQARDMPNPPIRIEALGSALRVPHTWFTLPLTEMATRGAGDMMWNRTDFTPKDVDTAQLYDGFSIKSLLWLEGLRLCPPGESGQFVEGGHRISLGGELPLNTNGGQLSEGRTHGMGFIYEACTQLWGRGGARQVDGARVSVVAAGGGPLAGSVLLVRE